MSQNKYELFYFESEKLWLCPVRWIHEGESYLMETPLEREMQ